MKFDLNTDVSSIKQNLKTAAKDASIEEVLAWDTTTWSVLISISLGLNPFSQPSLSTIPEVFRAFLPRLEFKPSSEDRQNAYAALWKGLDLVNSAIVETTKATCDQFVKGPFPNMMEMIQASFPGGLDEFLVHLRKELLDYNKRKLYLQTGYSMMTEEQAWLSKHHTLAVAAVNIVSAQPKKILTSDEYSGLVHDAGILVNGKVSYSPSLNQSKDSKPEPVDALTKALKAAEADAAKSQKKLLDFVKKPKKK